MDENDRAGLVSRLFALITAKLEDAAGRAVDGQTRRTEIQTQRELAEHMHSMVEELLVLTEATAELCAPELTGE